MGSVGEDVDERWEAFGPFYDYLIRAFPPTYADGKMFEITTGAGRANVPTLE